MKIQKQFVKVGALALSLVACGSLQAASNVNTGQHKEANFNRGSSLSPFALRNTTNGNYVRVVSKRLKMFWAESNYLGNRNTRSAEIWSNMSTRGDVYVGFRLNIPTTGGSVRFPSNKNSIIAQFMQRTSSAGASTWCMVLEMNGNHLNLNYRGDGGTRNITTRRVKSNFPRNQWKEIMYHVRPGQGNGIVRVWYDGRRVVDDRNTKVGFGRFTNTQKWGMYNADAANYSRNETRTIYMDDIGAIQSTNGLNAINP